MGAEHRLAWGAQSVMAEVLLTIAIPTFNRGAKLHRLLSIVRDEIVVSHLQERVCVVVSDNASADSTPCIVSQFANCGFGLTYHRQPDNLGFDGNLRFLYTHSNSRHVWFLADDDVPLPGAVSRIVAALQRHDPDVLLFSFVQPPGCTTRQFDYPEPLRLVVDPVTSIECVLRCTKVSIYVLRRPAFHDAEWRQLDGTLGDGWYYISLALAVLARSTDLRVALISEPLAGCDNDFRTLAYVPSMFLRLHHSLEHPFVLRHCPGLVKSYYERGYYEAIQFCFAAKTNRLRPEDPGDYDRFIKGLPFRGGVLVRRPRSLLQFMALKLGISGLWLRMKPLTFWLRIRPAA